MGLLSACAFTLALSACGSGGGNSTDAAVEDVAPPAAAQSPAPVANAGALKNVIAGSAVTLDGSASQDPDAGLLTYAWTLDTVPPGSAAALSAADTAKPSFVPDLPGTYVASLVVSNGKARSKASSVTITVTAPAVNAAPAADPGRAQSVVAGATVTLNGSASKDANGDGLTYAWTLMSIPSGSRAVLSAADSARPSFVADVAGTYLASLTVHDGKVASEPQTVTVEASAANAAPVAKPGAAQSAVAGTRVRLDGSASTDANHDRLTFAWTWTSRPEGSAAVLAPPNSPAASFLADLPGVYVASLIVNDGQVDSEPATVAITVTAANAAPNARASATPGARIGQPVTLDGSGSTDPNEDPLTYAWTVTSAPLGSAPVVLDSPSAAKPSFVPTALGDYVFSLRVSDPSGAEDETQVTITVAANAAPVAVPGPAQFVALGSTVSLDGSASSDPEGDPLTYRWRLSTWPGMAEPMLNGKDAVTATFQANAEGDYVVWLSVSDGTTDSAEAQTTIISVVQQEVGVPYAYYQTTVTLGSLTLEHLSDGRKRYRAELILPDDWEWNPGGEIMLHLRGDAPITAELIVNALAAYKGTATFDVPVGEEPSFLELDSLDGKRVGWLFPLPVSSASGV